MVQFHVKRRRLTDRRVGYINASMFKPLSDYILIKPLPRRQSATLEVVSKEKYSRGLVVAVGPGERNHRRIVEGKTDLGERVRKEEKPGLRPMQVKPGDWVTYVDLDYYAKYHEDGIDYVIAQEKDVTFVSDREFVDAHHSLSDAEVERLVALHNQPLNLTPLAEHWRTETVEHV